MFCLALLLNGFALAGHVWQLSLRQRGSRAVQDLNELYDFYILLGRPGFLFLLFSSAFYLQEAIELCTTDEEREAISSELAGHIWEAVALHSL